MYPANFRYFAIRARDGRLWAYWNSVPGLTAGRLPRLDLDPDVWPKADVILFAPATFNSLNSWALGLTQNFVVGVVAEGIGKGIPTVTMPCVNAAYAAHRQLDRSITELREQGVTVLYGEGGFTPNPPGSGTPKAYPWDAALASAKQLVDRT
ncbi:hypothetical protein AB0N81_30090 [Streptomyces sp. NPDC093510]|uniref:hypothetical protein n=1 Tax=Streptomyces sp. NPDC093510 TaxID=3155199 RepID=UPI0034149DF1